MLQKCRTLQKNAKRQIPPEFWHSVLTIASFYQAKQQFHWGWLAGLASLVAGSAKLLEMLFCCLFGRVLHFCKTRYVFLVLLHSSMVLQSFSRHVYFRMAKPTFPVKLLSDQRRAMVWESDIKHCSLTFEAIYLFSIALFEKIRQEWDTDDV